MTSDQKLGFYATPPHRCSYLPDQQAVTLFADPRFPKSMRLYTALSQYGFRRSGPHLYIPQCPACQACVSVRVPVHRFRPGRRHRRIWKKNRDLQVRALAAEWNEEHFELYSRYIGSRHAGGGMDNPTPDGYMDFLATEWADTVFYELRKGEKLVAVAVTDMLEDGLSAVYTFYDPDEADRSPGVYSILLQLYLARERGLNWLYLGYWVRGCRKMEYKIEFRPLEYYYDHGWHRVPPVSPGQEHSYKGDA